MGAPDRRAAQYPHRDIASEPNGTRVHGRQRTTPRESARSWTVSKRAGRTWFGPCRASSSDGDVAAPPAGGTRAPLWTRPASGRHRRSLALPTWNGWGTRVTGAGSTSEERDDGNQTPRGNSMSTFDSDARKAFAYERSLEPDASQVAELLGRFESNARHHRYDGVLAPSARHWQRVQPSFRCRYRSHGRRSPADCLHSSVVAIHLVRKWTSRRCLVTFL